MGDGKNMNAYFIPLEVSNFEPLASILEEKLHVLTEITQSFSNSLWIQGEENELYIKSHVPNRLVIARILVTNQRKGIGTSVLTWLEQYALNEGFEEIMIESSLTVEMNNFAEKHGFEPDLNSGLYVDGFFYGNWIKSLNSVNKQLF